MPLNKLALLRYKTIDKCLRNRFRKWTLDDLVEACANALYEYEGITQGVSRRTVQLDIQNMRSDKLGYNAPIVVQDKKFYSYDDRNYSITNNPLSKQDVDTLTEVVGVLKQFKGFSYFDELTEMVSRLEDKLYKQQHKGVSYIDFEKNEQLKGLEHIDPLHKALMNKRALLVTYQSFKRTQPTVQVIYPYLLKEYRNRWFLLGRRKDQKETVTTLYALDRMVGFSEMPGEPFVEAAFNPHTFFNDVIGVTKTLQDRPQLIELWVDKENAPYVITKPLHPSQEVRRQDEEGIYITINVVMNFELEREILGFGERMKVLSPRRLQQRIKNRLANTVDLYINKEAK
ncbi:MAG: helix-turn-helix transcriptional regulator [Bacteroidota bacterium]